MEKLDTIAFKLFILFAFFAIPGKLWAAHDPMHYVDTATVKLTGTVYDEENKEPLAFASVAILDKKDSALIDGVVTDEKGKFLLETTRRNFMVRIEYLSYEPRYFSDFSRFTQQKNGVIQLNNIYLTPSEKMLEEVRVRGQREQVQIALDKKIFNVGEDISRFGGNAQDILDNIPSVTVDVEGNVSLRGSDNVRILIDGKQSGLVGISSADALRQLPSNMVERVEVITNPSARYDAAGMAGIINIVLKKDQSKGLNGSFDLYAGYPHNYNATANLNYRHNKFNFFGSYGFRYRENPGNSYQRRTFTQGDTVNILVQDEDFIRSEYSHTFRLGMDYMFNDKNTLTGAFLYRTGNGTNENEIHQLDYDGTETLLGGKIRKFTEKETEPNLDYNLTYKHDFDKKNQTFTLDASYTYGYEEELADIEEFPYAAEVPISDELLTQFSSITETQDNLVVQADYIQPIFGKGQLEAGYKSSIRNINNEYFVEELREGEWVELPEVSNQFDYDEGIHALYATIGDKGEKITYQVGVRVEATRIGTRLIETNEVSKKDYINFFPTGHFAYTLKNNNAVQISYSRRIDRPHYRMLSPFYSYTNPYYIRTGNPDLDPEFTHSLELSHMKNWETTSLSSAIFYRYTEGEFESIERVNEDGVTISRPENLSTENSMGFEFVASSDIFEWWQVNGSANFFRSIVNGENLGEDFYADAFSWFARVNSRMNLKVFDFQAMFNYRAPRKTTQGRREAFSYVDLALARDVLNDKGTLSLKVSDLFNTRRFRSTSEGDNFYIERQFRRSVTQVTLGFTYRLNQEKRRERSREDGGSFEGDGDEF